MTRGSSPTAAERSGRKRPDDAGQPQLGGPAAKPADTANKATPVPKPNDALDKTKKNDPDWLPIWSNAPAASKLEAVEDGRVAR
ncbi:MAG: hypothetical protein QM784_31480 [Polyangiaceae bacterium]